MQVCEPIADLQFCAGRVEKTLWIGQEGVSLHAGTRSADGISDGRATCDRISAALLRLSIAIQHGHASCVLGTVNLSTDSNNWNVMQYL